MKMRDYVITVNSTVDLPKEWLAERGVPVAPLQYMIDGETYTDMEGIFCEAAGRENVCYVTGNSGWSHEIV